MKSNHKIILILIVFLSLLTISLTNKNQFKEGDIMEDTYKDDVVLNNSLDIDSINDINSNSFSEDKEKLNLSIEKDNERIDVEDSTLTQSEDNEKSLDIVEDMDKDDMIDIKNDIDGNEINKNENENNKEIQSDLNQDLVEEVNTIHIDEELISTIKIETNQENSQVDDESRNDQSSQSIQLNQLKKKEEEEEEFEPEEVLLDDELVKTLAKELLNISIESNDNSTAGLEVLNNDEVDSHKEEIVEFDKIQEKEESNIELIVKEISNNGEDSHSQDNHINEVIINNEVDISNNDKHGLEEDISNIEEVSLEVNKEYIEATNIQEDLPINNNKEEEEVIEDITHIQTYEDIKDNEEVKIEEQSINKEILEEETKDEGKVNDFNNHEDKEEVIYIEDIKQEDRDEEANAEPDKEEPLLDTPKEEMNISKDNINIESTYTDSDKNVNLTHSNSNKEQVKEVISNKDSISNKEHIVEYIEDKVIYPLLIRLNILIHTLKSTILPLLKNLNMSIKAKAPFPYNIIVYIVIGSVLGYISNIILSLISRILCVFSKKPESSSSLAKQIGVNPFKISNNKDNKGNIVMDSINKEISIISSGFKELKDLITNQKKDFQKGKDKISKVVDDIKKVDEFEDEKYEYASERLNEIAEYIIEGIK